MARELCGYLETEWQQLVSGHVDTLMARYEKHLWGLGKQVRLRKGADIIEAEIRGVDKEGRLKVGRDKDFIFTVGEVEWMFDH
jgi:biotin-(acetyl-CoA carboxylase) ligase